LMQPTQQVQIPQYQHPFCDDPNWISIFGADIQASPRQLQRRFQRLVTIGVSRKQYQLAFPRRFFECPAEQNRGIPLHNDLRFEIASSAETPVLMRRPGVAIDTGMEAATVGVKTPSKRQVGTLVSTENIPGGIVKHLQFYMGGRLQEISVLRLKRIGGIHHRAHIPMLRDLAPSVNGVILVSQYGRSQPV